jgi:hypothetical protein
VTLNVSHFAKNVDLEFREKRMNNFGKSLLVAGIILLWCAGGSWAYPVSEGMVVTMANDWDVPYTMTGPGFQFETFCLESQNYFTPGKEYKVTSVGDIAYGGGGGADPDGGGDRLDDRTKWLYAAYMSGDVLNGTVTAQMVQEAIWFFEEEQDGNLGGWFASYYNDPNRFDAAGWDVRAVNLSIDGSTDNQSQLVGVAPVPEPATMLLLGTGLVGLAGVSRKKFKK